MDMIARAIAQMTLLQERTANAVATTRVRAINCKSFKLGDDWNSYSTYFQENVRAAHGLAHGDVGLNAACCSWIGSKLEAGPTLTAYEGLSQVVKNDWTQLNAELARLYINEEEKQSFLANVGGFKKGSQSLLAYKNELARRVNLYQPDLHRVADEYQRQLVDRFIGGLEDTELQKKLRFHCRRDKMDITEAFEYAVDYESTEVESKAKELASTARAPVLSAIGKPSVVPHNANFSTTPTVGTLASSSSSAPMRILERSVDPKIKANEIAIEQIKAAQAKTNDTMEIMRKEFDEKISGIDSKMDKIEFLLTATQTIQHQGAPALPAPAAYPRPSYQSRAAYQPRPNQRPYRQPYQSTPGLTGGPGYRVDPRMRTNWQRPVSADVNSASASAPTATGVATAQPLQPQAGTLGACASMPHPQPVPQPQYMPTPQGLPLPQTISQAMPQSMPMQQPMSQPARDGKKTEILKKTNKNRFF